MRRKISHANGSQNKEKEEDLETRPPIVKSTIRLYSKFFKGRSEVDKEPVCHRIVEFFTTEI